jgi:hypothetical protein
VLLIALVVLALAVLGFAVVAKVVQVAMRRLSLEPMSVLLFFGVAEEPADELSVRRTAPVTGPRRSRPARATSLSAKRASLAASWLQRR